MIIGIRRTDVQFYNAGIVLKFKIKLGLIFCTIIG